MSPLLTPVQGACTLAVVALALITVSILVTIGRVEDRNEFLLASRSLPVLPTALSIAASWIWAPSLFVAAQKAYEEGLAGVFWFTFPNFLCLIVFAPLAARLRKLLPAGFTLPQYMRARHGPAVHILYLLQFFILQICCFAVQVLAGAALVSSLCNLNYTVVALSLVLITFTYAALGGMRASVATDFLQMAVLYTVLAVAVPWAVTAGGGSSVLLSGLGGASGSFGSILNPWVAYSFGVPVTIGLLSGPLGDQMQWQRSYVVFSPTKVRSTFRLGAALFIIVPLALSQLGFLAAGANLLGQDDPTPAQLVGPITIARLLPPFMTIIFIGTLLSALCSTLDSVLCAISSLVSTDIVPAGSSKGSSPAGNERRHIRAARFSMALIAIIGLAVAHIPGLQVLHLFLFYGTCRASTMIPTILTLLWPSLNSKAVLIAILASLLFGSPLYAYGAYHGDPHLSVAGSLLVPLLGGLACVAGTLVMGPHGDNQPHDVSAL